jgi:hypothetical protein
METEGYMIKKRYLLLVAVVLCAFGCSKSDRSYGGSAYSEEDFSPILISQRTPGLAYDGTSWAGTGYNPLLETEESASYKVLNLSGSSEISMFENTERKLAKRAQIRIKVDNLDMAYASITALMEKHHAYTTFTEAQENSSHRYSISVPSSEYDAFLAGMSGMGRVLRRSETTEDVTLRYYDLEGRLATKRELLKTYQSYLEKAKNIEEILSVEARLADLHNEIDGTGKELRNLANRVDYATIDLTLLGPVTATPDNGETVGEKMKGLFGAFGGFLSTVAVVLVGIVVYGIPILLLLTLFFWLFFGKIGLMKKLWRVTAGKANEQ